MYQHTSAPVCTQIRAKDIFDVIITLNSCLRLMTDCH